MRKVNRWYDEMDAEDRRELAKMLAWSLSKLGRTRRVVTRFRS